MVQALAAAAYSIQFEWPWPQVFIVDGPTIFVVSCGPAHCAILQCVTEVDEPATEVAFVAHGHFLSPSGIRVEKPEDEPGYLVVDACQLGDEHQLVMPVRTGHHFTPRTLVFLFTMSDSASLDRSRT